MGQSTSQNIDSTGAYDVVIHYMDFARGNRGFPQSITIRTTGFADVNKLRLIANTIKRDAKNRDIAIAVELGADFTPTINLKMALDQPDVQDIFKGLYVDGLRIHGSFLAGTPTRERIDWWNNVQTLIKYVGLSFNRDGEIIVHPLTTGILGYDAIKVMSDNSINLNIMPFGRKQSE
jgi:hypothetical protein